jgi:uncharacterized damage-inducible protein DinB
MPAKELLDHYADYGHWANTRIVRRLEQENDAMLDRHVPSSFPSLRATLMHIRNAEHTWWCRLNGVQGQWPAEAHEAPANLLKHSARLREHVHALNTAGLQAMVQYADLRGNMHSQPAWHIILHCINHSTQHRGQLITMMRALGLGDIPANDLVVFQRTVARN